MTEIDKYICTTHGMDYRSYCSDCTFAYAQINQILEDHKELVAELERQGKVKGFDF